MHFDRIECFYLFTSQIMYNILYVTYDFRNYTKLFYFFPFFSFSSVYVLLCFMSDIHKSRGNRMAVKQYADSSLWYIRKLNVSLSNLVYIQD